MRSPCLSRLDGCSRLVGNDVECVGAERAVESTDIMGEGSTTSLRETPTLVVGVGALAGGLADTRLLLSALPVDCGMAFVLVQHTEPEHEGLLPELFGPSTSMPVVAAEAATAL